MAMTEKDKKQVQILAIIVAVGAVAFMWFMWRAPIVEQVVALEAETDTLRAQTDSIRTQLRSGSSEDIDRRIQSYTQSLAVMRELVPNDAEATSLLDDITTRAQRRGVRTTDYNPVPPIDDGNYEIRSPSFTMLGTYDDLGAFISDIASLPRILVPEDLSLTLPQDGDLPPELEADSTRVYLRADFRVTTYVKPARGDLGPEAASVN